jgi:hypothetical protein
MKQAGRRDGEGQRTGRALCESVGARCGLLRPAVSFERSVFLRTKREAGCMGNADGPAPQATRHGRLRTSIYRPAPPACSTGLLHRSASPVCCDAAGMLPKTASKTASRDIPAPRAAASFCNLLLWQPPRGSATGNSPVLGVRHARYAMFIVSLPIRSPIFPCTSGGSRCSIWRRQKTTSVLSDESPPRHPRCNR